MSGGALPAPGLEPDPARRQPPTRQGVWGLSRVDRWPLGVVLAAALALWVPRLRGPIDLRYDAGVYFLTGSALVEGRGYVIPSEPGAVAEVQYPPGLPAVAAAVQKVVGSTDAVVGGHAMRLLYFVLTVVYAATVYVVARRYLPPGWSAFAALLTTLHANTVFLADLMQAELPYALVTTIFFAVAAPRPGRGWRSAAASPARWLPEVVAVLAFLVRTAGLALLGAWVLDLLLRRRWRRAAVAAAVAVAVVGGWQLYARRAQADRARAGQAYAYQYAPYQFYNVSYLTNLAYVDPFKPELGRVTARQFAARTLDNGRATLPKFGELVSADAGWWVGRVHWDASFWGRARYWITSRTLPALAVLPLLGLAILAYRGAWIFPLYALASVVLIVVTPWPGQFWRYLTPLMPLFTIAAAVTLDALAPLLARGVHRVRAVPRGRSADWAPRVPALVIAAFMLGVQAYTLRRLASEVSPVEYLGRDGRPVRYRLFYYGEPWRKHDAAVDWIARHATTGSVVITTTPQWVYLRTGLQSVMPPFEADPLRAVELMASVPGRYLILDELPFLDVSRRYAAPAVARFPERWRLVFPGDSGGSSVYESAAAPSDAR